LTANTFAELREPLTRYVRSIGLRPPEAEEVVQETFCRLCEQNGTVQRGWLFRVAHNLARDEQRVRMKQDAEPLLTLADQRAGPELILLETERARRLRKAMERLPRRQQECLHLRAEGLKYREISEVLGVSVSTVAEWVQTALRSLLEDCDDKPSR
jgi:RNA polymerase sigma-70 factor, ECF subfamily